MAVTIEIVPDTAALANRGADLFVSAAQSAAAARGVFAAALSGGSTPRGLYETLARRYAGLRMPWPRVQLYWGDERCVPPDHPDSNYGMARAALIARVALPPENVHRMRGESEPAAAARAYEAVLRSPPLGPGIAAAFGATGASRDGTPGPSSTAPAGPPRRTAVVAPRSSPRAASTLPGAGAAADTRPAAGSPAPVAAAADPGSGIPGSTGPGATGPGLAAPAATSRPPVFDMVLLGLGGDGHTASLFPHTPAIDDVDRLCVPNTAPDGSPRLTLTFPVINAARRVVFIVSGAGKAGMVAEVVEGLRVPAAIPAQRVDPRLGELVWLLDEEAASELSPPTLAAARRP
jgi:6-phosphogluconolactonase/glucosamine-6-phosphate isomerase/deaminase